MDWVSGLCTLCTTRFRLLSHVTKLHNLFSEIISDMLRLVLVRLMSHMMSCDVLGGGVSWDSYLKETSKRFPDLA